MSTNDNNTAPKIEIPGFLMLPAPELTVEQAFSNFEELARGTTVGGIDRLRLIQSLKAVGDLVGHLPEVTLDEAVNNFDALAAGHSCTRDLQMALIQSVKLIRDMVDVELARVVEEAKKKAEEDGDKPADPAATSKK